ncbi:MAG: serine hydrolase [Anaerolineae bacterium]|nr:serine hydrolase [Anaerolineae bacterium]
MQYGTLRDSQRGLQLPWLEIVSAILLLIAIVLGMIELVQYSNTKDSLQTDLTIAGIPVGGLEPNEAQARWEAVYVDQPIMLLYEGNTIMLDPVVAGFDTNSEAMLAEARAQSSREKSFWLGFWNYLWRRPVAAVNVPLDADYSEGDLRNYLQDLAARYDAQPGEAGFDMGTLTFRSGTAGSRLDIDAAADLIAQALFDPEPRNRRVVLPTVGVDAPRQEFATLRQAILDLMNARGFVYNGDQTLASVYVLDLATGAEIAILADVPHSGVSTIKVPIMINLFRNRLIIDDYTAYLLTASILCSENSASNFLMQLTGEGQDERSMLGDGLNNVSCTAQALGAEHTFISAPLYVGDPSFVFEWPVCRPQASANATYNTNPDLYSQTTAEDMGQLLTEIYDCANSGSGLMAVYPEDITQTECQQMIEVMSGNRIDRLIELGVPLGTRVAHKNGWGPETTGDAGIIFSPGGDYILVMYTWELDVDGNNLPTLASWELIEEVSRLVYNYFNPSEPMIQRREPINPYGAIDCVVTATEDQVNLNDVDENRVDENGIPLPGACYGGPGKCREFDNWGQ